MRLLLADGTLVDTGDAESVAGFRKSHGDLLARLDELGRATRADAVLQSVSATSSPSRIRPATASTRWSISKTAKILQHLMIGSEGTLGFIAEITYRTVPEHAHKASALLLFPGIERPAAPWRC